MSNDSKVNESTNVVTIDQDNSKKVWLSTFLTMTCLIQLLYCNINIFVDEAKRNSR